MAGSSRDAQSKLFLSVMPHTSHVVSPTYVTLGHGTGSVPLVVAKPVTDIQHGLKNTNSQRLSRQTSAKKGVTTGLEIANFFVKRLSSSRQGREILERLGIKQHQSLTGVLVRRISRVMYGLKASLSGRDLLLTIGLADFMKLPKTSSASPGFLKKMAVLDFAPITLDYRNRAIDDLFVTAYGGLRSKYLSLVFHRFPLGISHNIFSYKPIFSWTKGFA